MKNKRIEPLDAEHVEAVRDMIVAYGDMAAAEELGVQPLTVCRAALGLALQWKVRDTIIGNLRAAAAA